MKHVEADAYIRFILLIGLLILYPCFPLCILPINIVVKPFIWDQSDHTKCDSDPSKILLDCWESEVSNVSGQRRRTEISTEGGGVLLSFLFHFCIPLNSAVIFNCVQLIYSRSLSISQIIVSESKIPIGTDHAKLPEMYCKVRNYYRFFKPCKESRSVGQFSNLARFGWNISTFPS